MPESVQSVRAPLAPLFVLSSPTWKYPFFRPALAKNPNWAKLTAEGSVHGRDIKWQIERKRDKYEFSGTLEGDSQNTGAYLLDGITAVPVRPPAARQDLYLGMQFRTPDPHDPQTLEVNQQLWVSRGFVVLKGMIEKVSSSLEFALADDAILADRGHYGNVKGNIGPLNLNLRFDIFDKKWEIIGHLQKRTVSMNAFIHRPKTADEPWSMDWRARYPGFEAVGVNKWRLQKFTVNEELHVQILSPSQALKATDAHRALDATKPGTKPIPPNP